MQVMSKKQINKNKSDKITHTKKEKIAPSKIIVKKIYCKHGYDIKKKYHCLKCEAEKDIVSIINKIVDEKEGICIYDDSDNITISSEQIFICKNNHTWVKRLWYIKKGFWCAKCSNVAKLDIGTAHKVAKKRNGHCLSEEYVDCNSKLLWQCYLGHEWYASLNKVKNSKNWCPKCNINVGEEITRKILEILFNKKFIKIRPKWLNGLELDGYSEKLQLAFEYDGIQHTKFIKHFHRTEEEFQKRKEIDNLKDELCEKNDVILLRIPYHIGYDNIKNYIIELCDDNKIVIPNNIEINYEDFKDIYRPNEAKLRKIREIIESKEGTLLTDVYINNRISNIMIKCHKKHSWTTSGEIIKSGHWCPYCAKNKKHTIEEMQILADEKNGKCLSKTYINGHTKLLWECKKDHQWMAVPKSIIRGHWCPECNR
jgi:hypothetical protein